MRDILAQTLAYENHFRGVYRRFLLGELASSCYDPQHTALHFLNQILK